MELQESVDIEAKVTESVLDVFDTMLSLPVEAVEDDAAESGGEGRVVGAVNFAGDVQGLITFDVSASFSKRMAASMMGIEVDEIESDDEVKDLLGEVSNIIGGNLKSAFTDAGLDCSISTPSITLGSDFTIKSLNMDNFQRFAFRYEDHRIFVEVGLKFQKADAGAAPGETAAEAALPKNFEAIARMDLRSAAADSLVEVCDTMLSMEVAVIEEAPPAEKSENYLVGSVNFTGEIMGIVSIGVPDALARRMTASMLGIEIDEIESDDEIKDLLGEISNIVGGNLKSSLTDAGIACRLSPPAITIGTDFRIESLNMETYDRLVFGFQEHRGVLEVGVKGLQALKDAATAAGGDDAQAAPDEAPAGDPQPSPPEAPAPPETPPGEADPQTQVPSPEPPAPSETPPGEADLKTQVPSPEPPAETPPSEERRPPPEAAAGGTPAPRPAPETGTGAGLQAGGNLDVILDIPLEISVELGRTRMKLSQLLEMSPGAVVELARLDGEPVDILANDKVIARGEVIVENEKYGIRITEVLSRLDRIKSLR